MVDAYGIDPTQDGWEHEPRDGHETLGLHGIKLMPMDAGFRPDDARLDPLWRYATHNRLPVLLHTGEGEDDNHRDDPACLLKPLVLQRATSGKLQV